MKKIILISLFFYISFIGLGMLNNVLRVKENTKGVKMKKYDKFNVIIFDKRNAKFGVSETKPNNSDFYINSNFFSTESTIGLVVVDNKKINPRVKGGGFFYIKNGIPYVSAKKCPKNVEYASQTILWGIDNGIVNEKLLKEKHSNRRRYRTLMGETVDGEIVVISSNFFGLVTIEELINFSIEFKIKDGILLDGGSSVDYKFSDKNENIIFSSVSARLKKVLGIKKPTTYIYGNIN